VWWISVIGGLLVEPGDVVVESIEAGLPDRAVLLGPVGDAGEWRRIQRTPPVPCVLDGGGCRVRD